VTFFLSFFILGIALLVDLLDPIEVHRPTTPATDEEMERFYQDLSQAVKQVPKGDMLLVMGDFNAKVGSREPSAMSSTVGLYGLAETNEAGEQLEDVRLEHQLALANTVFKQHPKRLHTWTSPDGNTRNQIDYSNCAKMENKLDDLSHVSGNRLRHRSSVACGYAESQAGKKTQRHSIPPLNLEELKEVKSVQFAAEVTNRFSALEAAQNQVTAEDLWNGTKTRYDTRCYFNVRSKADISQLIYRTEPTTKKCKNKKKTKK